MKSAGIAYLLWLPCLFGVCGLHRFYLEKPGSGVLMFFCCGACYIWTAVDLFMIPDMVNEANRGIDRGEVNVTVINRSRSKKSRRRRDDDD